MSKANIRFDKIEKRQNCKSTKQFTLLEKKVIKNHTESERISKELSYFWSKTAVYKKVNGTLIADQEKTDWSIFNKLDHDTTKINLQYKRFLTKDKLTIEDIDKILNIYMQINRGYLSGGSY